MIKAQCLTKTYKSKKGSSCAALRGVSLDLDEKGMVFILGKSGSGKSTLLNILGGLDVADSGEITICGESSGSFRRQDYDIYRNSYAGFVFQDFGILEDLTVGENIEFALKLQGRKDEGQVDEILNKVGLNGYEKRRQNELSGGEKQRVSIARSLVKNPKIIFADEPTGSLDNATGTQIFNLLKELSATRLVVVVSHDKESAFKYGDRIIELSDGLIISDTAQERPPSANMPNGNFNRIKTKMPISYALKMAISGFKQRIFRFLLAIIISVLVLSLLGLSINLNDYNKYSALINSFDSMDISAFEVRKYNIYESDGEEVRDALLLGDEDIAAIGAHTQLNINKKIDSDFRFLSYQNGASINRGDSLYNNTLNAFVEISGEFNESALKSFYGATLIEGDYPKPDSKITEALISDYTAQSLVYYGIRATEGYDEFVPNSPQASLIGKTFLYNERELKIAGIYKTNFESLEINEKTFSKSDNRRTFRFCRNVIYQSALVCQSAYLGTLNYSAPFITRFYTVSETNSYNTSTNATLMTHQMFKDNEIVFADENKEKLEYNEIVLSLNMVRYLLQSNVPIFLGEIDFDLLNSVEFGINIKGFNQPAIIENAKIVGFHTGDDGIVVLSDNGFKEILNSGMLISSLVIGAQEGFRRGDKAVLEFLDNNGGYYIHSAITEAITTFDKLFELISKIIDYALLAALVLALFVLFNFISASIVSKSKEIGILRALGATGFDVAKIFIFEGIILCLAAAAISTFLIIFGTGAVNASLIVGFKLKLVVVSASFWSIFAVYLTSLTICAIAGTIPLLRLIKMRPIEAIKTP